MGVLDIEELSVEFGSGESRVRAVDRVSLTIGNGETLGLVGESGCGKSTLILAVLGLMPPTARREGGRVIFDGRDVTALSLAERRRLAFTQLSYVPQSAMNSLDPVRRLGDQFARIWERHRAGERHDGRRRAEALFERVGLERRWLDAYPHELSGGMRQRAIIAFALMFEPRLLVADEPTTGLDVIVQAQVLDLLQELQRERNMAMILVSHDVAVIAESCRRVAVMYAGRLMEIGTVDSVFGAPSHPYTMGLYRAFPDIRDPLRELISIPGAPPQLVGPVPCCPFGPRCPFVIEACRTVQPTPPSEAQDTACHRRGEASELRAMAADPTTWQRTEAMA